MSGVALSKLHWSTLQSPDVHAVTVLATKNLKQWSTHYYCDCIFHKNWNRRVPKEEKRHVQRQVSPSEKQERARACYGQQLWKFLMPSSVVRFSSKLMNQTHNHVHIKMLKLCIVPAAKPISWIMPYRRWWAHEAILETKSTLDQTVQTCAARRRVDVKVLSARWRSNDDKGLRTSNKGKNISN